MFAYLLLLTSLWRTTLRLMMSVQWVIGNLNSYPTEPYSLNRLWPCLHGPGQAGRDVSISSSRETRRVFIWTETLPGRSRIIVRKFKRELQTEIYAMLR